MQTNMYAEDSCMHVCAHTHAITDRSHMCTNSVIYRTTERTQNVTHVPTQSYLYIQVAHIHTPASIPRALERGLDKLTGPSI